MNTNELAKVAFTREVVVNTYAKAHDHHLEAKLVAMHSGDMAAAYMHEEASRIALRAYRAEAFNPLPDGLP